MNQEPTKCQKELMRRTLGIISVLLFASSDSRWQYLWQPHRHMTAPDPMTELHILNTKIKVV